jgi:hypothetical protein
MLLVQAQAIFRRYAFEAISLAGALLVAEQYFKFGSFTLEALAFLATWRVIFSAGGALARLFILEKR